MGSDPPPAIETPLSLLFPFSVGFPSFMDNCSNCHDSTARLDAVTQTVTVKGPERTVDLKVRDPEQFKLVAVGDQIQATYTEALAVAVTPVAKPAAKAAPKKEKKGGC